MNPKQLYQQIRVRFDYAQSRRILKEKYEAKLIFANQTGMWKAGPELITVLKCCNNSQAVIEDLYQNPVLVNVAELQVATQQRWQEQMNAWLVEFEQLNNQK